MSRKNFAIFIIAAVSFLAGYYFSSYGITDYINLAEQGKKNCPYVEEKLMTNTKTDCPYLNKEAENKCPFLKEEIEKSRVKKKLPQNV